MVEHGIADAAHLFVTGDGDHGDVEWCAQQRVYQEKAVDGALCEQAGILVDEIGSSLVADDEVQVAGLEKVLFHPIHDHGEVAFTELRHNDADGEGLAGAKRAREKIGLILELLCRREDALPRFERDALRAWRIVHHQRDGCRGETEMFGQGLKADGAILILRYRSLHGMG